MAYTEFSTERAKYVLQLVNPKRRNTHDLPKGIDALVIETGKESFSNLFQFFNDFSDSDFLLSIMPDIYTQIKHCKENTIPIFSTDVPSRFIDDVRGQISDIMVLPAFLIYLPYAYSKEKIKHLPERLFADYTFLLQSPILEGRNAINARKIEEYVVPMVRETSGKEYPMIGLVFGTCHIGLKYDLISKQRREFTLWNYRNLNFGKYFGFNKENLDRVHEARCIDGMWQVREHKTNLFS